MTEERAAGESYTDFAPYYDLVYEPVVDYEGDVRYLGEMFQRYAAVPVRRVLDLGCGTGSHAVRLARLGFEVDGVDLSRGLLALAKAKAAATPNPPRFHHADMAERLPAGPFDAAISMFGAFNYVADDDRAERLVDMLAERVERGGLLVFEFWNPIGVRPGARWDISASPDGLEVVRLFESTYDLDAGVVILDMRGHALRGDRVEARFHEVHRLRARTPHEVRRLLEPRGFEVVAFTGGAREGKTFETPPHDEFRIMAVARRT